MFSQTLGPSENICMMVVSIFPALWANHFTSKLLLSKAVTMPSVWSYLEVMVAKEPHSHRSPVQVTALEFYVNGPLFCVTLKPQLILVSLPLVINC